MKTKFYSFIVAFALFSFAKASNPEGKELLKLSFKSDGIVSLIYNATVKSYPRVTISDANRKVVFSEKVSNNYGVLRNYDISTLPEGEYFFEVADKDSKTVKSIIYKKNLANAAKDLNVDLTPGQAGKYVLTCKGVANQSVYVSIYNKSKGVVFEDYIDLKKDFSRVYDLSKLRSDTYVFEVSSNDRKVAKEVSLDKSELSLSK